MAISIRDLFVTIGFDIDDKPLQQIDRSIKSVQRNAKRLAFIFTGASVTLGIFLKQAGDFEQIEIAFDTMIGNVKESRELLDGLKEDARRTPFTLPGILIGAKRLLAFGRTAEVVREDIDILGNIAAGVGRDKFPNLILAFGQVATATRLRGQEIRQFTEAGVPILEALGEQLGKTAGEIQEMTSRGEISFDLVRKALKATTEEGGRFFRLMERQSLSFLGILSNIKDFLIITAIAIGKELLPQAKAIATEFITFLEVNQKIIRLRLTKFFKSLAETVGILFKAFKAVLEAILNVSEAMGGLEKVIKTVVIAMLALTGLSFITGIGAITIAIFKLISAMKTVGTVAILMQAKMVALPILVGAAVIALGLIIEDIIGFFRGKDSLTGVLLENFEKKFPEAFERARQALMFFVNGFKTFFIEAKIFAGFLKEFLIDPLLGLSETVDKLGKSFLGKLLRGGKIDVGELLAIPSEGFAGILTSGLEAIGLRKGMSLSPSLSPTSNNVNNRSSSTIKIDAPITVAPGTTATEAKTIGENVVKGMLGPLFRATGRAVEPQIEF